MILLAVVLGFAGPAAAQTTTIELGAGLKIEEYGSNSARTLAERDPALLARYPAPALAFSLGEIYGLRDVQGGQVVPGHPELNRLDVGAGNGRDPGVLALGADVTRRVVIHVRRPGRRPVKKVEITPRAITLYGTVRVRGRIIVGR